MLLAAACGPGPEATDAGVPDAGAPFFIALVRDFSDYAQWESVALHGGVAEGQSHVAGDRTVYLNRRPPKGAKAFPVGTVLVKTVSTNGQVFAMAKRGGRFNGDGAIGWEWFELISTESGVAIRWRGLGPPAGFAYGGQSNSGCNNCHTGAWANDFVQAEALALEKL